MNSVSIIGAGAWGTALAMVAQRAGSKTNLWVKEPKLAQDIQQQKTNVKFPANIPLDEKIQVTANLKDACQAHSIVIAVPAQSFREVAKLCLPYLKPESYIIIASKGIEVGSGLLMSQVMEQLSPEQPIAVLSGPNFADEIAQNLPASTTLATASEQAGILLAQAFNTHSFKVYLSQDIIGTQIAGALKNVLAIALGVFHGRNLGANARAALLTRGLVEISNLVLKMGGKQETILGLAGVGDICLTCTSEKSRNMLFGKLLGSGMSFQQAQAKLLKTVEGVLTAKSATLLGKRYKTELPTCSTIDKLLHHNLDIDTAIQELLN